MIDTIPIPQRPEGSTGSLPPTLPSSGPSVTMATIPSPYLSWFFSSSPWSHVILLSAYSMLLAGAALTLIRCQYSSGMTKRKGLPRPWRLKLSHFLPASVPFRTFPWGYHHYCHLGRFTILWAYNSLTEPQQPEHPGLLPRTHSGCRTRLSGSGAHSWVTGQRSGASG